MAAVNKKRKAERLLLRYLQPIEELEEVADTSSQQNNMTQPPLVLSIDPLKFIEQLPNFDGKGEDLFTFLELVEDIIPLLLQYDTSSQNLLLNRIKSKLRGKAREIIEINNHIRTWSEIRSVLVNSFGDKKSSFQIFDELRAVTFNSNSVEMYNQIKNILRRLNNKSKDQPNVEFSVQANNQTALNIFKDKLPEPMRSILFSRNPETLEKALDILVEGNYAYFNPFKNNRSEDKYPSGHNQSQKYSRPNHNFRNNSNNFRNNNGANNGQNQHNYRRNSINQNQRNFNANRSENVRQNQYSHPNNTRVEPMDVDKSINSRVNALESENTIENFPLEASETNNHFLI